MAKWENKLSKGKEIRRLVKSGNDNILLIKLIRHAVKKEMKTTNEYKKESFEELYLLLIDEEILIKECREKNNWDDYCLESESQLINERMTHLYDLCDEFDIWIAI